MLEPTELRRGDWYGEAMKKPTQQAGLLGSVFVGVLKCLVGFRFGILILGNMSQGFHGMGLLTKIQRI